jgi:hypothetical protein
LRGTNPGNEAESLETSFDRPSSQYEETSVPLVPQNRRHSRDPILIHPKIHNLLATRHVSATLRKLVRY